MSEPTLPTERMTPQELAARLDDPKTTVIDVRPSEKYREGHVPGALHIPIADIKKDVPDLPKDHLIVTYCGGGTSGPTAAGILREHGYNAVTMQGMNAWRQAGLQVVTGDSPR